MGHNLNYNEQTQKYSLFSTRKPWHKLGTVVDGAQTSQEAIELAGLNFTVDKYPIVANTPEGPREVPGKFATVRTDNNTPFGVVGDKYTILQNADAFTFFDTIVGNQEAVYEAAGCLKNGETVFITARLPERIYVGNNDEIETFLFLTNSHDGSKAVEISFINHRVICENTLKMALRNGKNRQRIRHTASVGNNLLLAADLMGITRATIQEVEEQYNALSKVKITEPELRKFIELALRPEREQISSEEFSKRFTNQVDKIMDYAHSHPSQLISTTNGTLFGAFNAITGNFNNIATYKDASSKVQSLMYGTGYQTSNKALDLAMNVMTGQLSLS